MARRTLNGIEDKILMQTVKMGAQNGIESISTKKIAKCCDISEPTIYVHFKTKRNLIVQAGRRFDNTIRQMMSDTYYDFQDKFLLDQKVKSTWLKIFDFLLAHPNDTKYYNRYRHSAFYEPTLDYAEDGIYTLAVNYMLTQNMKLSDYKDIGYPAVMICAIDSTLNFAETIIDGKLKKSEKIIDLIFKLIFGMLL
ncbi:MAG: TetR/AcrR family transcriptional regulator [Clostridia bacterium]|nr:TetR/AcrR family transcriptional regulator [Clostridia bacterium]